MTAILIRPNKISKKFFMATFATSLLSTLGPNTNFDPSVGNVRSA